VNFHRGTCIGSCRLHNILEQQGCIGCGVFQKLPTSRSDVGFIVIHASQHARRFDMFLRLAIATSLQDSRPNCSGPQRWNHANHGCPSARRRTTIRGCPHRCWILKTCPFRQDVQSPMSSQQPQPCISEVTLVHLYSSIMNSDDMCAPPCLHVL
jgi:hypothetical protein